MDYFFTASMDDSDIVIANALNDEKERQQNQIELIASENIVSQSVLDALGHQITNKTLEGYPGTRFHRGGKYADIIEQTAIDRACELFQCDYANVQPHSGSQANLSVFLALLNPGDKILSLDLASGGHLSHGYEANISGQWFNSHHYLVDRKTGILDYEKIELRAASVRPKLIIAGGSAYPRQIDFERMAFIAKKVDALLLVDMAHTAGLVAGGVHPSPVAHADIVTCTTTKTLRGPRGGLLLSKNKKWLKQLNSAVFPGIQGSLHTQIIAAKAVCLGEALRPEFKLYTRQILSNAAQLANTLLDCGIKLVSQGTDTHLVLLDLSGTDMTGKMAEDILESVNITSNKNPVPFDQKNPGKWRGLRLGAAAATTRGFAEKEFKEIGEIIAGLLLPSEFHENKLFLDAKRIVQKLCQDFPIYQK
ncbi:MAG: serine hydroxymethyltransferase [Magnetovibrio sp.]|nr:serine hydroxymethyltransferase [Magnetovibrio sp.]